MSIQGTLTITPYFFLLKKQFERFANLWPKKENQLRFWSFLTLLSALLYFEVGEALSKTPTCFTIGYSNLNDQLISISANFKRAMNSSGICVDMVGFPSKRGTKEFRAGRLDGYNIRIKSWAKINGLQGIMVPTPIYSSKGYLISHEILSNPLSALKNEPIGVIRGSAWSDKLIKTSNNIMHVTSHSQLVKVFLHRRVKGILISHSGYIQLSDKLIDKPKYTVAGTTYYFWLHSRHAAHLGEFNRAIVRWKSEGHSFLPSE